MQIKKILKYLGITYVLYLMYCLIRGFMYGLRNGAVSDEKARKIATFRG